ncbi:MAG: glycosyl hydrolase-related protein, partial [Streptomyces sp.]|uniref:glycosyl hydrolase-related protein n=1 Tax=Streptomyces sp. TaxID=1931 RepID=UPI003D6ADE60
TVTFALLPYTGEWHEAGVHAAAESFRHPLVALPGTAAAGTVLPGSAEGLRVEGTGVVLSSPRERDGRLEVRLCAQTPHAGPAALALPGLRAARRCDLLGNPGEQLAVSGGGFAVELRAWEIATFQLER